MNCPVTLIYPILNEKRLLEEKQNYFKTFIPRLLQKGAQVAFVDGGSRDGSEEYLTSLEKLGAKVLKEKLEDPTVAKTLLLAKDDISTDYLWIIPIDCEVKESHFQRVLEWISKGKVSEGEKVLCFFKRYNQSGLLLNCQAQYLNHWRLKLSKQWVWTNCPVLPSKDFFTLLGEHTEFLSDVVLSQKLKQKELSFINDPVVCSSRRYQEKGVFRQIMANLAVMTGFHLGFSGERLKKIYHMSMGNN